MLFYYLTDRRQFPGSEAVRRIALLDRIGACARAGVDLIQLREKDLEAGELAELARAALKRVESTSTRLLINSRSDVALAVGAHGVHLTSRDVNASDVRALVGASGRPPAKFLIAVSCHSVDDVRLAESHSADIAVLAPIFEKPGTDIAALGLEALRQACAGAATDLRVEAGDSRRRIAVRALGGITLANAAECIRAGADGVAGIRLFQQGDVAETVRALRER